MKKQLLYISAFILLVMMSACKDYLDKQPDDMLTDDLIWNNRTQTENALYAVYGQMPFASLHQNDPWIGCSDECDLTWNVYPTYNINLGNWNPSTNFYVKWASYYKGIRSSFVLENNVDRCPDLSNDEKAEFKAEAQFMRGYYYWMLVEQYGPVVLLKTQTKITDDFANYSRAPLDSCITYICDLMDKAEKVLPPTRTATEQRLYLGKPDQVICKAVKAKALFLAANPIFNGNKEYSDFKNPDGTPLVNTTYDPNKWKKAAIATKEAIDFALANGIKLYRNDENADGAFSPYKSYRDVMLKNWNCEIIFGIPNFSINAWEVHASPGPNNLGGVGPTQRLVDAFYMKNGKTIDDPQSGYVETGFATTGDDNWNPHNYNLTNDRIKMIADIRNGDSWGHFPGEWNMYANREPRFYASILYNKRIIPELPDDIVKRNYYSTQTSTVKQQDGYGRVEFYYGGTSRSSGSYTFYPRTGYLTLKNVNPQDNMRDRAYVGLRTQVIIRYAEMLLNYIESLNEYDPTNPDIKLYWDQIRSRAGLTSIFDTYPGIKGNRDQQLEYILRERQVEMNMEGDRYRTIRRRWLATTP
ncbi:MAG: RagB/SusD family nutrient uptake outer membrane protein, partial [Bacteroidota bacterium]|nr:RagB/SusD family nutrient uptake outer membrane protein [Bacteroidota bacterium]